MNEIKNVREAIDMARKLTIEASLRKKEYDAGYDAEHTTRVFIKLNNRTDADILAYLSTLHNKQGTIKRLIREHMAREEFAYTPEEDEWETQSTP